VEPTKAYADLIIPEGGNNEKALQVLTSFMQGIR
jgi:uridine kinase